MGLIGEHNFRDYEYDYFTKPITSMNLNPSLAIFGAILEPKKLVIFIDMQVTISCCKVLNRCGLSNHIPQNASFLPLGFPEMCNDCP